MQEVEVTNNSFCRECNAKHHTSFCDKGGIQEQGELLLSTVEQGVIQPVVLVRVNGISCRALLDTGSGSSTFRQSWQI